MKSTFFTTLLTLLLFGFQATAQDDAAPQAGGGPSAEELAKANNPLADLVAFNVQ